MIICLDVHRYFIINLRSIHPRNFYGHTCDCVILYVYNYIHVIYIIYVVYVLKK